MYVERGELTNSHHLEQGDILRGLICPTAPGGKALVRLDGGPQKIAWPTKPEDLSHPDKDLRIIGPVERKSLVIVLSNSCDNEGDYPLIFAPVRPFKFTGDGDNAEKWLDISEAATGTASPKLFYLPGDTGFGLERSEALLPQLFSFSHSLVQRCIDEGGAKRVCGASPDAQRHLQWALGLLFSRDPRDDHAWPSNEDLALKLSWIERQISDGSPRAEALERERAWIRSRLGESEGLSAPTQV